MLFTQWTAFLATIQYVHPKAYTSSGSNGAGITPSIVEAAAAEITTSTSKPTPTTTSTTTTAATPQSTACGYIVNENNENGTTYFTAAKAYECLTSVPFNPAVATRFLQYYKDTLQFQSTLAYLKNPPAGYQQPGVDLLAGLATLQQAVNTNVFSNQYEFEAALQALLYAAHDGHLYLQAGILAMFSFMSPLDIVSLSVDGVQTPKVYIALDIYNQDLAGQPFVASAIETINGQNVTDFLYDFASHQSFGTVEPHADWNKLMLSMAQGIQGDANTFSGVGTFYPGDTITFGFENGSSLTRDFLAVFYGVGDTGPLETGGDFYNLFVLGLYPDSYFGSWDDSSDGSDSSSSVLPSEVASTTAFSSTAAPTISTVTTTRSLSRIASATATASPVIGGDGWGYLGYPDKADIAQPDLTLSGSGFITGYLLNSSSVSVLSIPSFAEYDTGVESFVATIDGFLSMSLAAGNKHVVVDLQANTGGHVLLAFNAFRLFFPGIDVFAGSRMRAHDYGNIMGSALTDFFGDLDLSDADYEILASDEWVATTRLNAATNRDFTSWAEFFGPYGYNGDNFTATQRYNLTNRIFAAASMGGDDSFKVEDIDKTKVARYAAENIILLTDGTCGSACTLFVEMMHHEAGVRVVTVGGRPTPGPMQAASGARGAIRYDVDVLDDNIELATVLLSTANADAAASLLPNRTQQQEGSIVITGAGISLRDQVRRTGLETPLQFTYDAADCRIYYTRASIFNYTRLWLDAAAAIWTNPKLCVTGSTGYSRTASSTNASSSSAPVAAPVAVSSAGLTSFNIQDHIPGNVDYNVTEIDDIFDLSSLADQFADDKSPSSSGSLTNYLQLVECTDDATLCNKNKGFVCMPLNPSPCGPDYDWGISVCMKSCPYQAGPSCKSTTANGRFIKGTCKPMAAAGSQAEKSLEFQDTKTGETNPVSGWCDISSQKRKCTNVDEILSKDGNLLMEFNVKTSPAVEPKNYVF